MAKNAAAKHYLSKALCFLILLIRLRFTLTADAVSLCYNFTFGKSESGSWWNEVQGQLNIETFIDCDSNNNCHAIGLLGNKLSGTKIWKLQVNVLKDAVDLFKAEVVSMREPLTLQATMHCGYDVNGDFHGSWDFGLNGQKILPFDSRTRKLTEVDFESSQMKSMLEKNGDITDFLYRTSQGDCRSWLEEFKSNEGEKLEPTGLVKESTRVSTSLSPTTKPDGDQPSSMANKPNFSVLLIILPYSILLWFLRRILDNEDPRHSHSALTDMQIHTNTHKIETNQAAAAAASRTPGAVSPLEAGGTELLLESTASIWTAQMDKVEDAPEKVMRVHLVQPFSLSSASTT